MDQFSNMHIGKGQPHYTSQGTSGSQPRNRRSSANQGDGSPGGGGGGGGKKGGKKGYGKGSRDDMGTSMRAAPPAHLGNPLADLLRSVDFACAAHRDQRRKDRHTAPYINHPIGVAWLLARHGVTDPAALEAAVLHDTIEDTEATYEDILREFGKIVADTVADLSDDKSLSRQERKHAELTKVRTLAPRSKLVKLADKLYNVRDLIEPGAPASWTAERSQAYVGWAYEVMRGCFGVCESLDQYCEEVVHGRCGQITLHDGSKVPMLPANYQPGDWLQNTPNVDPAAKSGRPRQ